MGFAAIQAHLDDTLNGIEARTLQTTTLAPGDYYGGIAVVDTLDSGQLPQAVTLQVDWNGDTHPFKFYISEDGSVPPPMPGASQASVAPVTLTVAKTMPIGHVSKVEQDAAVSAAQAPEAPKSFQAWRQPTGSETHTTAKKSGRTRAGISITGAVN
jgi:hypothetical protein